MATIPAAAAATGELALRLPASSGFSMSASAHALTWRGIGPVFSTGKKLSLRDSQRSCSQPMSRQLRTRVRAARQEASSQPRLVTVLGKGGVGKTTAAVLLAKLFAAAGMRTCFVTQSVDRVGDELFGVQIGAKMTTVPMEKAAAGDGGDSSSFLCAIRLESTKLLLEPLQMLKAADERLGVTQGALAEVVGEELSILPGMDAVMALAALEALAKPAGGVMAMAGRRRSGGGSSSSGGGGGGGGSAIAFPWGAADAEVVVYDGPSSLDSLRLLASPERARWYLRRFRTLAERTDVGRVALPSVARLAESTLGLPPSPSGSSGSGQAAGNSAEIWASLDRVLSMAVEALANPLRTSVFLVTKSTDRHATLTAQRLWGCACQAGVSPAGILVHPGGDSAAGPAGIGESFPGLPVLRLPNVAPPGVEPFDWEGAVQMVEAEDDAAGGVLVSTGALRGLRRPLDMDVEAGTVTLFLPGFEKTDVRLQKWKGGSQLLVDAGDQRRCIDLPPALQGKIVGAKFADNSLQIKIQKRVQ